MADPNVEAADRKEDFGAGEKGVLKRWLGEIEAYEKKFKDWSLEAKKIRERFRLEKSDDRSHESSFNVLWSNVRTLQPALFSRVPEPNITRRFRDKDPAGRSAALIIERSLSYCVDEYDFDAEIRDCVDDYLLAGRGQAWARYIPVYDDNEVRDRIPLQAAEDGFRDEDGEIYETPDEEADGEFFALSDPYKPVIDEEVVTEYVNWADFGHTVSPRWTLVTAVWRRAMLSREQLKERFGDEAGDKVPLKTVTAIDKDEAEKYGNTFKRAQIYEIWDKESRKVYWISKDYPDGPLDTKDDPLGLEGFFPCPRPLYDTMTGDSLVPIPEYREYQSQAEQVDELTERMDLILSEVRVAGVYDGTEAALETLIQSGAENKLIGVSNWAAFAEKGGLSGAVSWLPMAEIVSVLKTLYEAREKAKEDLYEITGLADIIRGASDPGETATAQGIKGRYAGMRLESRQNEVSRFIRAIYRIKAEIIAEKFSAEKIRQMSDYDQTLEAANDNEGVAFEQALEVLREDGVRSYRLDFETDATVAVDQDAEKKLRIEFLSAVTPFIAQAAEAAKAMPGIAPVLSEILMFTVRGFKTGRDVESTIEEALQAAGQTGQQPDPAAQAKAQAETAKAQAVNTRAQADMYRAQTDRGRLKMEAQGMQQDHGLAAAESAREERHSLAELETMREEILLARIDRRLEAERLRLSVVENEEAREVVAGIGGVV